MPSASEIAIESYVDNRNKMTLSRTRIPWHEIAAYQYTKAANDDVVSHSYSRPVGGLTKRTFDIVIAATGLILLAPILIATVGLILITMGRPIFFSQSRVGFKGGTFNCLKFRSMIKNAEQALESHLEKNPAARSEWSQTQKLKNDPRVTWLGKILRKSSLDELPQLINILRGDMSCIGPRPVLVKELDRFGRHSKEYKRARPGLSGLWQVSGRNNTTYAERVKLDTIYVRRWSILLDIKIMLRTVPALFKYNETA